MSVCGSAEEKNKEQGRQRQGRDCVNVQMSMSVWCTICHMLGLDSLTQFLTQKCLGVLAVFDSDLLAQLLNVIEWQRLREQISRNTLCPNLHHIAPPFIPRCLQPQMSRVHVLRQPKSLTCCVVHHPLVVACNCHTRVVPEVSEPTLKSESLFSSCSVRLTFPRRKRHRLLPC